MRERKSHIFEVGEHEHYVENKWVGIRLCQEVKFSAIHDPCCGFGNMVEGARAAGIPVTASDIVDRGYYALDRVIDFLEDDTPRVSIITNPPFTRIEEFAFHALEVTTEKVAFVVPAKRIAAMWKWASGTPLSWIYYLTPRPSMPPGFLYKEYQEKGEEGKGDTKDYAILLWEHGYHGYPRSWWIHRDGGTEGAK